MDETIGICTIVYSGYGRFIEEWAVALDKLTVKPSRITLVLGDDFGDFSTFFPNNLNVQILHASGTNMGHLKNLAVEDTKTDWIIMLEVDDPILPNALEEFKKHQDGDLIICPFKMVDKVIIPKPTLEEIASGELWLTAHKNFFHGSVPFRRTLWEKNKFNEEDNGSCSTALFFMDCAKENAKLSFTEEPCLVYNRRSDSHSMINSNERNKRATMIKNYKKTPKFSVYMIVKNEEQMIEEALKSIQGADEIIVCDTGSTDKTIEIAKKYTDKVYTDYKWNDNFSEAKNHAASKCKGEWLMGLDADCRLEPGGIEKIRDIISRTKYDVINIWLICKAFPNQGHYRAKIYRNNGKIFYSKDDWCHENFNILGKNDDNGVMPIIYYDYSPNHNKDPERNIRILEKMLKENPKKARTMFYLASEYYFKKRYKEAIDMFNQYFPLSTFTTEKAEAYVKLAECYWYTQQGELARQSCGKAILINPDYGFALRLMASMHYEPHKSKWNKLAKIAEDKDVLFKR
jgi:glycosyltransferase involved in cell wall biosynthesis